jgi:hypothetical protein
LLRSSSDVAWPTCQGGERARHACVTAAHATVLEPAFEPFLSFVGAATIVTHTPASAFPRVSQPHFAVMPRCPAVHRHTSPPACTSTHTHIPGVFPSVFAHRSDHLAALSTTHPHATLLRGGNPCLAVVAPARGSAMAAPALFSLVRGAKALDFGSFTLLWFTHAHLLAFGTPACYRRRSPLGTRTATPPPFPISSPPRSAPAKADSFLLEDEPLVHLDLSLSLVGRPDTPRHHRSLCLRHRSLGAFRRALSRGAQTPWGLVAHRRPRMRMPLEDPEGSSVAGHSQPRHTRDPAIRRRTGSPAPRHHGGPVGCHACSSLL